MNGAAPIYVSSQTLPAVAVRPSSYGAWLVSTVCVCVCGGTSALAAMLTNF